MTTTTTPSVYWVCVDCYEVHHGVSEAESYDAEPLSMIPEGVEVTSGMLWGEHDCANAVDIDPWAGPVECECETRTFTWSRCDGCGSALGGSRHALTVWERAS